MNIYKWETKEEQHEKKNQEVNAQVRQMHQSEIKCNGKTGTYLTCLLQRDWSKCWIERKSRLNVLTLHMRHGLQYRQQRI